MWQIPLTYPQAKQSEIGLPISLFRSSSLPDCPIMPKQPKMRRHTSVSNRRERTVRSVLKGRGVLFYHYRYEGNLIPLYEVC